MILRLPLVESLINQNPDLSFAKVKIIGVQHILETTHAMFRSLYKLGLKPENISIIGKCYSTCLGVYEEMKADGVDVSPGSFAYSSHLSYDELFAHEIKKFLSSQIEDLSSGQYDLIIVLDDGGKCIKFLSDHLFHSTFTVGIEQTSSGYEAIRSLSLPFPVINVARSPIKLNLESPMIAQAAAERLYLSIKQRGDLPDRALIIGGGVIGQAMRQKLSSDMQVSIYDHDRSLSDFPDLKQAISHFPLIVGCTGKTSIPHQLHSSLSPGTMLVSVSSSDREFDAVYLRKCLPENDSCFRDLEIDNLFLINSGFPVNFDGDRENIDPKLIQLTIALITAGILQARLVIKEDKGGILPLDLDYEQKIENEFLQITSGPNNHFRAYSI